MSFADYKSRRASSSAQKLAEEVNKLDPQSRTRKEDTRFWRPTTDKLGNGYAVIRFLPSPETDDLVVPFVTVFDHGFQGPTGKWYIENSLTTIGQTDPLGEMNSLLWNSGSEADKEQARKQKRRLHYIANIYVVKDPSATQNEGKVFLYKIGPKIYNKIKDAMTPNEAFPDEKQIVPYDMYEGANFKLKIRKVEGFTNYDTSSFDSPEPLFDNDAEMEKVYNQLYSLKQFVDPEGKDVNGFPLFKPYDELKKKLYSVLELVDETPKPRISEEMATRKVEKEAPQKVRLDDDDVPWSNDPDEGSTSKGEESSDDTLEFFKRLAAE